RSESSLPTSSQVRPIYTAPLTTRQLFFDGTWYIADLYHRGGLPPGATISGPAILVEPLTTTIIDPGWRAQVLSGGELLLTVALSPSPSLPLSSPTPASTTADPILLEVFNNHLTSIATQMGITLRNTSMSVNVKERLDFSCAIFMAEGDLVVNA